MTFLIVTTIQENSVLHEKWVQEYGPTLKYKALFGVRVIVLYMHCGPLIESIDDSLVHYGHQGIEPCAHEQLHLSETEYCTLQFESCGWPWCPYLRPF